MFLIDDTNVLLRARVNKMLSQAARSTLDRRSRNQSLAWNLNRIHSDLLSATQFFYRLYVMMRAAERISTTAASWNATADRARGSAARRSARVRRDEQHIKNTRVVIVLSVFLAFLAAALLIGGRAFIGPMLRSAADARQSSRIGEVVFTMPDGAFCRHLSFDNKTAEISESTIDRCPEARPRGMGKESASSSKGFAWGAN